MIGKKNIVFGFLYLVTTASLGFLMIDKYDDFGAALTEKQSTVGRIQQLKENDFEEDLEPLSAAQIAKANSDAILSLNRLRNEEMGIDLVKGGPHTHGNLESLLNIAAGVVLMFIAVAPWFKQLISWLFILGAVFHSGMLYLSRVFDQSWAEIPLYAGPPLMIGALLAIGIAAWIGLRGEVVRDG